MTRLESAMEATSWSDLAMVVVVFVNVLGMLIAYTTARSDGYDLGYRAGYEDAIRDIEREQKRLWVRY